MALTRDFRETVRERALRDPAFRRALLREAGESMLTGDVKTAWLVLRNYINATAGFGELARQMDKSPKSLMRMFSPSGNPRAENVFRVFDKLQNNEGVRFKLAVAYYKKRNKVRKKKAARLVRRALRPVDHRHVPDRLGEA